jgi:hypothetical protein
MKNSFFQLLSFFFLLQITLAARGVCVFELDNTLLGVKEGLSRAAIAACKSKGYALGINTAAPSAVCKFDNVDRLKALGLSVPKAAWLCSGNLPTTPQNKLRNMGKIQVVYGSTKTCTLLFDNTKANTDYLTQNGFPAVQVNTDDKGISSKNLAHAMDKLKGCDGKSTDTGKATTKIDEDQNTYLATAERIREMSRRLFMIFPNMAMLPKN